MKREQWPMFNEDLRDIHRDIEKCAKAMHELAKAKEEAKLDRRQAVASGQ